MKTGLVENPARRSARTNTYTGGALSCEVMEKKVRSARKDRVYGQMYSTDLPALDDLVDDALHHGEYVADAIDRGAGL
jgi:hypothetical protein